MSKLVTFEQANRLNKLGFKEETSKEYRTPVVRVFEGGKARFIEREPDVYDTGKHVSFYGDVSYDNYISAPTLPEALDWIRDNYKGLFLSVRFNSYPKPCYVGRVDHLPKFNCTETKSFESHSDCNSALLDAVLTYLEENNHGNK